MAFNLNKDTAVMRGVRTAIQAIVGFVMGLIGVVWAVPGVPQAVSSYVGSHGIQLALAVGIPAGLVSFIWNWFRKDVKNV